MPYTTEPFNRKSFPIKVLQYLAAGLPVVSTSSGATDELGAHVLVADEPDAFEAAVRSALDDTTPKPPTGDVPWRMRVGGSTTRTPCSNWCTPSRNADRRATPTATRDVLYHLMRSHEGDGVATTNETARSLRHAMAVVRRWWLLIAIGTVIAGALGAAVSAGSGAHFTADTQVVVTQPAQILARGNESSVQRLADLMNTISQLATSDQVLEPARQSAAPKRSLDQMRTSVTATVVPNTLVITIHTDFPTSGEAKNVGTAVAAELKTRLGRFASSASDPVTSLTLEDVRAPIVEKVPASLPRTLLVAFILGFGFSVLAAFALDRG